MAKTSIKDILKDLHPDVHIIDAYWGDNEFPEPTAGIKELISRRAQGDLRPVLMFGFEGFERLKKRQGGNILNVPGVFYLKLPCSLRSIENIFQKIASAKVPLEKTIDDVSFRQHSVDKIRAFKHTCDNIWMSMEANANSAKKELKSSKAMPSALKEFCKSRMEELAEEYEKLEPLARRLGIKGAEKVPERIEEAIHLIDQMVGNKTRPPRAVSLAVSCAKKIEMVAKILGGVKGLDRGE